MKPSAKKTWKSIALSLIALWSITTTLYGQQRIKVDGVAAVVGDYVILESDIEKTLIDLRNQGAVSYTHLTLPTNREV